MTTTIWADSMIHRQSTKEKNENKQYSLHISYMHAITTSQLCNGCQ